MSALAGAGVGLLAGAGAWLAVARSPLVRRTTLDDRLAPYLRDTASSSRLLAADRDRLFTPFPTLERVLRPVVGDLVAALDRWVGGVGGVRRRLDQLGGTTTLEQLRVQQVLWGATGLLGAVGLVLVLTLAGDPPGPLVALVLCVLATVGGVLARDRWLTREVRRRDERILLELPTVAELLALAVTAGEGPVGALERVIRRGPEGALARELARALQDARSGASLVQALEGVARRTTLAPLGRFVDGIVVAVERGTPLADVLRAQAVDVREAGRRQLLETAGRREIAMMVPVVMLVLPTTVVFALYPGFYGLRLVAG